MATGADYEVVDVGSGEEITNPGANDVMVAFHKSTGALEKIDYNKLAKAIIEQYTGSTIGGAAQSVKAALDTVSTRVIRQGIASNTDLNDIVIPGFYSCATGSSAGNALNKPDGVASSLFLLNVYQLDNPPNPSQMSVVQEYISDTYGGYHYIRSKSGSTWTEWKAMHSIRSMPVTIDANTDINTITNVGTYRVTTVANARKLINKPSDLESPFIMDVRWSRTTDVKMQIIYEWLGSAIYIRRISRGNSWADATFSDWIKQPTRAEMDALTTATSVSTGINGLFAFKMGNIVWIRMYDCAYDITGTLPESLRPKSGVHFCAVSGSADRKVALVSINAAGEVDVNSQITSGYIYGGAVYMT